MNLGIDFGTTNSSVARYDGAELFRLQLDAGNDNPHVLPSLIYIDRDQRARVGTDAANEYLARETGRKVSWERRAVGEIDFYGAEMHYVQDVHVLMDTNANGRLLQYVKTALRDPLYDGTQIFDRYYTVDELIAIILRHLKTRAQDFFQTDCRHVVLGRPVKYSDDHAITARAEEIMFQAARLAGFDDVRFELEPVGAAYEFHRAARKRQRALIFDFGGGTLDFTVAELGGKTDPKILATHGVLVGGDDLDRRMMQTLSKYFGGRAANGAPPLPAYLLDLLDNWQTMPALSRPPLSKNIEDFRALGVDPTGIAALKTLVARNVGFKLFREIEQTKKRLSESDLEQLDFEFENIAIHKLIMREYFERLIQREIEAVERGVRETLVLAATRAEKIDIVLRTGGTSAVPVFTTLLANIFGDGKLAQMDLLTSVVGGLAVVAFEGGGKKFRDAARYDAEKIIAGALPYAARIGAQLYRDAAYTIARLPAQFSGLPAIQTAQADKRATENEFIELELLRRARVFIAYDANAKAIPHWLRAFTPEKLAFLVDERGTERALNVYGKDFDAGRVVLGGNYADGARGNIFLNYAVIVRAL
ncbi:MAG: Hsp70 family protein [Chloroflexi bacterium]|nr:Hsp70 family protein [Chloroflexota bacterium]